LRYGDEELMCGFVRESVRRHKGAEALIAELKESVDRFRILYNNAPVMLQACDFETRIFSVNQYWLQTMGYQWHEVMGRQTLEFMTEATRNAVNRKVLPILRQDGTIHDFEYQLIKKSGEVIDVALTAVSDLDEDGRIIRTLSMLLPISDRKRAERLESQNVYLREELNGEFSSGEIIGSSEPMQEVFRNIEMVAGTDSTVLLLGETGTGKELVAGAIHRRSIRKDGMMVKVNCSALPSGLVENELFGHEKGAFTGATTKQKGRFELADKSTIFLDEVGELPLETQSKLLRVLQDRELERVGGTETIKVDVRVIAATNRNLEEEVKKNRFRSDLYYRLNIFPIRIPPLRERIDDVPLLASYFVHKFAARMGKKISRINRRAMEKLVSWDWPGNVRELANILERGVILCQGKALQAEHIGLNSGRVTDRGQIPTLEDGERRLILMALEKCNGRLAGPKGAADLLGVNRSTLWSRMKKLGIKTVNHTSD
jgi:formate hydrogenlyase transcriptional activator